MDVDTTYHAWLAALARSDRGVARGHALVLRQALEGGDEPAWTAEARRSFDAWCAGEHIVFVPIERRTVRRW